MQLDGRGLVAVNNVDSSYSRLEDIGDLKVGEPCSYNLGESSVGWIPRQSSLAASYSHVIAAVIFDDMSAALTDLSATLATSKLRISTKMAIMNRTAELYLR
jgi:hypothetical protein